VDLCVLDKGILWERVLFALAHFCVFHPTTITHLSCVFPSLVDDTQIFGHALDVVPIFKKLHKEFIVVKILVQPTKCVTWFPQKLNQFISFPLGFLTPKSSIVF
jgi:hypothetical protein